MLLKETSVSRGRLLRHEHQSILIFLSACVDRKKLKNKKDVKMAFRLLDVDNDGKISLDDLDDIFCSYAGAKMTSTVWNDLLKEADLDRDGVVSEGEFTKALGVMLEKTLS